MAAITEITTLSWLDRIKQAIVGVAIGLLLFAVSFPVLFINEGRAVKTAKSLAEGRGAVISIDAGTVDPANDGQLVHVTGMAETHDVLTDDIFGVTTEGLSLIRTVEMFQWEEHSETKTKKKLGGGEEQVTTYSYSKSWSPNVIDSSSFKETQTPANPSTLPFENTTAIAGNVSLGAFALNAQQVNRITGEQPVKLTSSDMAALPANLKRTTVIHDGQFYYRPQLEAAKPAASVGVVDGNGVNDVDSPASVSTSDATSLAAPDSVDLTAALPPVSSTAIGDVRVSFSYIPEGPVSVIAAQQSDRFTGYQTQVGRTLDMLSMGEMTADAMFGAAESGNRVLTWILRAVGAFLMFLGIVLVLRPLSVMGDVLPIIGSIIGFGTSIIAAVVTFSLSLTTIAIAWVFYRPLIGIPLLVVAVGSLVFMFTRKKPAPAPEGMVNPGAE